jgi:hypothetical protein
MEKRQKDSVFGMVSQSFPIYEDGFDESGRIYVCESGLVVKKGDSLFRSPFEYVKKIEKVNELPLGKLSVIFKMYDQMGEVHDMAVGITDSHYYTLKKLCPNAEPKK